MATLAAPLRPPASIGRPAAWALPLLFLAAAIALRWPHFGDPLYDLDEQWYLLVGERLRHGVLPYVDLWDRKPIGLFLLYAALAWPDHAILAYQLGATTAAAATAWTIARLAEPQSDRIAGIAAGIVYLAWIETMGGGGGQSPIFYNLPVALAARLVLAATAAADGVESRRAGLGAMALIGVALQLKYSVVVEGMAFGLVLAGVATRHLPPRRWPRHVAALVALALTPTMAALACYALLGHAGDFWFANFRSIGLRGIDDPDAATYRLARTALQFLAFGPCWLAATAAMRDAPPDARRRQRLVLGWLFAAIGGYCAVGTYFFHYALPLFVPACVLAAPAFGRGPLGRALALALVMLPLAHGGRSGHAETERHQRELAGMVALIPATVARDCLAVLDGPPILYSATNACIPTRFAFSGHLISAMEARALGVDRGAEIDRLFARRLAAVAITHAPYAAAPADLARVARQLRAGYRLRGSAPWDDQRIDVWVRR